MDVKIDTKEKFTVFTPGEMEISVIMAEKLVDSLNANQGKDVPHLILNMRNVSKIDQGAAHQLASTQSNFYEKGLSFVICEMTEEVAKVFESEDLLDLMNTTPTESEAWDIVQMEEIERELLNNLDET
ncbi:MAG: STAS domain-containing protein [Ferruginibacter sp.]|nr:STAS domain-containing protein [Ferruginibacter sp.]